MEEFVTIARHYYEGIVIPFFYKESSCAEVRVSERFRAILVEKGQGVIDINGCQAVIVAPLLILLNHTDEISFKKPEGLVTHTLYFHPNVLNSEFTILNIFEEQTSFSFTASHDHYVLMPFLTTENNKKLTIIDEHICAKIKSLMKKIETDLSVQADEIWPCSARGYFIEFLFLIRQLENPVAMNSLQTTDISRETDKIVHYIRAHLSDKLTIPVLLEQFNTNRTTLSQKFKKATNHSVVEYITKLRLQTAASMLHNTDLDITRVMYKVGFSDTSYFGKTFRKMYGMSPGEYRKKYLAMLY